MRLFTHFKGDCPQSQMAFPKPRPHALSAFQNLSFRLTNVQRLSSVYYYLHFPDAVKKHGTGPTAGEGWAVDTHTRVLTQFTILTQQVGLGWGWGLRREELFNTVLLETCCGELERRLVKYWWDPSWSERQLMENKGLMATGCLWCFGAEEQERGK